VRFVVAIVAFVLAAAAIGLGVAQRTVLAGPASVSSSVVTGDAPLTVIDASTLNANAGTQSIEVGGDGDLVLAYGRTPDVMAWVGEAGYNEIGWDAEAGELTSRVVQGTEPTEEVPSPVGSDLWLREFTGTDVLTRKINAPEGISVIIAAIPAAADEAAAAEDATATDEADEGAEGADAASGDPLTIDITWPLDNSAPLSGPLVVGGIALLLVGLGAFLWALVHARGRRGPRRSTPRLPRRPKPPRLKPSKGDKIATGQIPVLEPARPRSGGRRRAFVAVGTALALALTGCTAATDLADPAVSATPGFETPPVVVTKGQFGSILVDAADAVADADAAGDAALAAERLTGAALDLRVANYAIRAADSAVAALPPIPDEEVAVVLPQQSEVWPRSVFAVARSEGGAPVGLVLTQETPRDNYKIAYAVTLVATVPDVAPTEIGAAVLPPGNNLGRLAPEEVAAAYGDILIFGEESESFDLFEADGDSLREQIGAEFKAARRAELPTSATMELANGPGDAPVSAFSTNDSGQIVAVNLDDVETVRPVEAGAAVNARGQVKALLGKEQSTRGVVATYGLQLLFYVPPVADSDGKIVLLGYAQGLVSAVEVG
jgi:hypothetical protein